MYVNKKEAAEILGIGERTLRKIAEQGKLSVKYTKGKNGKVAQFLKDEVIKLKADREQPLIKPTFDTPSNVSEDLGNLPAIVNSNFPIQAQETMIIALQNLSTSIIGELNLSNKLILTISEVKNLTGFSKNIIMSEIQNGKLKAKKIGRSWRVKKLDLEAYIRDL